MRSSDVIADIIYMLSDGKVHSLQEIADEVECSYKTAQRHVASLSYRYPINTVFGHDKQGVQLDTTMMAKGKLITNDKLQIIGKALALLQNANDTSVDEKLLKELIQDFTPTKTTGGQNGKEKSDVCQW